MLRNYACEGILASKPVAWYEPTFKSLLENWRWFTETLGPITKSKSEVDRRIDFINGGSLEMWSLVDKEASRGRHYERVVINEASTIKDLEYSWNSVIRITLADLRGGAMIGGTPKGRNFFWQLFRRGQDAKEPEWSSWQYATLDNPYISREEIADLRQNLPELIYRQEILGEFVDYAGSVFRRVQEVAQLDPLDGPEPGRQYVAGVDVAASVDFTVVTILDVESREMVYMDRFNRVDYPVLINRLAAICTRWELTTMIVESNGIGRPVLDELISRDLPVISFLTTSATKQNIIQSLQTALENGQIGLLNNPVLVGELLSFESKRNASGSFSYSAPEGMHDDCVMSLAFAWNAIDKHVQAVKNPFYEY